jgi:hypothetical protein
VVGRLHLDGGGERLLVGQRRQVERAHDDALVGDAQAHAARQVVLGPEGLQRFREGGHVGDLAVPQDAGAQGGDGAAGERHRPVDGDLAGGQMARVEVEADDRGLLGGALLEHSRDIGRAAVGLEAGYCAGVGAGVISRNVFCTMPAVPNALRFSNTLGS